MFAVVYFDWPPGVKIESSRP